MRLILLNLFVVFAVGISIAGDIVAKTWALNKRTLLFHVAVVLYTISTLLWIFWLPYVRLSTAVVWWQAVAVILTVLAGIFYFHEKLTPLELAAVLLVVVGILILSFSHA